MAGGGPQYEGHKHWNFSFAFFFCETCMPCIHCRIVLCQFEAVNSPQMTAIQAPSMKSSVCTQVKKKEMTKAKPYKWVETGRSSAKHYFQYELNEENGDSVKTGLVANTCKRRCFERMVEALPGIEVRDLINNSMAVTGPHTVLCIWRSIYCFGMPGD